MDLRNVWETVSFSFFFLVTASLFLCSGGAVVRDAGDWGAPA